MCNSSHILESQIETQLEMNYKNTNSWKCHKLATFLKLKSIENCDLSGKKYLNWSKITNWETAIITPRSYHAASKPDKAGQNACKIVCSRSYSTNKINKVSHSTYLFHEITFTSALWALTEIQGFFPVRISHIDIVPSTEQEANMSASVGLHCKHIVIKVETITFKETCE